MQHRFGKVGSHFCGHVASLCESRCPFLRICLLKIDLSRQHQHCSDTQVKIFAHAHLVWNLLASSTPQQLSAHHYQVPHKAHSAGVCTSRERNFSIHRYPSFISRSHPKIPSCLLFTGAKMEFINNMICFLAFLWFHRSKSQTRIWELMGSDFERRMYLHNNEKLREDAVKLQKNRLSNCALRKTRHIVLDDIIQAIS